ncbi:hypothetical protein BJ742DRAFT_854256 [Cladochytrium replicatum]|nr:hypothetical protein BJ742DRAFT_854256 [Cladochytrium replicatum]
MFTPHRRSPVYDPPAMRLSRSNPEIPSASMYSGFLLKKSRTHRSKWLKRHFRLVGNELSYYHNPKPECPPRDTWRLNEMDRVVVDRYPPPEFENVFVLRFRDGSDVFCAAPSRQSMDEWMYILNRGINALWTQLSTVPAGLRDRFDDPPKTPFGNKPVGITPNDFPTKPTGFGPEYHGPLQGPTSNYYVLMTNTAPVRNGFGPEFRGRSGDREITNPMNYPVEHGPLQVHTNLERGNISDLSMIRMFPRQAHNIRTPVANTSDIAVSTKSLADAISRTNFTAASSGAKSGQTGVEDEEIVFKRFSAMLDVLSPQVQSALGITAGMREGAHRNSPSKEGFRMSPESEKESLDYAGEILNDFAAEDDEEQVAKTDNISRRPSSTSTLYNSKLEKPQTEDQSGRGHSQMAPEDDSLHTEQDPDDSETNRSENATEFTKRQSKKQRITRIVTNVRRPPVPAQTIAAGLDRENMAIDPGPAAAQPPSAVPAEREDQLRSARGPASAQLSALGYNPMGLFTPGPILRAFFTIPAVRQGDAQLPRSVSPPAPPPKQNEHSVNPRPSEVAPTDRSKADNAPSSVKDPQTINGETPAVQKASSDSPTLPNSQPPGRGRSGSTYSLDSPNFALDPLPFLDLDALLSFCKGTMHVPNTPGKTEPAAKESDTDEVTVKTQHAKEEKGSKVEKQLQLEVKGGKKEGGAISTPLAGTPSIQPTRLMLMLDLISARSPFQPTERTQEPPKKSETLEDSNNKPMSTQNMRSRHALSVLMRDIEQEVLNFLGTPTTPQLALKVKEIDNSPRREPAEEAVQFPTEGQIQPYPWIPPPPTSEPHLPALSNTTDHLNSLSPPPLTNAPSQTHTVSSHSYSHLSPTTSTAPDSLTPISATSPTSSHLAHLDRHLKSLLSFLESPSTIYLPEFVGQLAFRASDVVHRARGIHFLLASPYVHSHSDASYSAARLVALAELHEAFAAVDRVVRMVLERMTQKDLEIYVGAKGSATRRKPPLLRTVGELIGRLVDGVEVLRLKCLQLSLLFA